MDGPGIDEPICLVEVADNNAVYYYHLDGLGSVVALSNVNRVLVERYTYDVFGRPTIRDANGTEIEDSAFGNPYRFTGRAYDAETALYYYRARYYDYATARFLQPDPTGYTDGPNVYSYCGNNSINYVDPRGLKLAFSSTMTPEERQAFYDAGSHLMQSQQFRIIYNTLNESPETYLVVASTDLRNGYSAAERTISWDPSSALLLSNGGTQSPAMGLAHEMTHAYHHDTVGSLDNTQTNDAYGTIEEALTIPSWETWMARELGEGTRSDRLGIPFPTTGVTGRTFDLNGSRDAWRLFWRQLTSQWLNEKGCADGWVDFH